MKWSQVRWEKDKPETAKYHCEKCDAEWSDIQRKSAIKTGQWIATKPFNGVAGFHLSGLYSSWLDVAEIANIFLDAKHTGQESLRVFVNTILGESWEDEDGEGIEINDLMSRSKKFNNVIPSKDIGVLCASADVQADRVEILINGYSSNQIYVIAFQIIYGNPTSQDLWNQVEAYIRQTFEHPSSKTLRITRTFIDSGYETGAVYQFCKSLESIGVSAIKGVGGENRAEVGRPSKSNSVRCNVFPLGVNTLKTQIMSRLRVSDEGQAGYIHFPDFLDEEFFLQLTAERLIKKYSKGIPRMEFKKVRSRNEALDLMTYNLGAFRSLNANMPLIQKKLSEVREKKEDHQKLRKSSWATNWRNSSF